MDKLKQWKNNAYQLAEKYEVHCTAVLLIIALILVGVAIFGTSHHKAVALLYIAL